MQKKNTVYKILYAATAAFIVIWSIYKYNLGVNKNFFFGQFAVIGVILMFVSMAGRMQRKVLAEKVELALEDKDYSSAALLMDKYIAEEKVPAQTFLGRGFVALLQNDDRTIDEMLSLYHKEIENADKYVLGMLTAAVYAKRGDFVLSAQKMKESEFDFSSMLNKDFYKPLVADIRDYAAACEELQHGNEKEVAKLIGRHEKHTLAGAYESIMNLLWEKMEEGIIYVLPAADAQLGVKPSKGKAIRTAVFYVLAAAVLLVPSDFNFKDEYDNLRQLNDRINFFNEVVCAYGDDEVYYLKYYDFNGNYNDMVFEVNDGKYSLLSRQDRFEQFMEGEVDGRYIRVTLFGSERKDSSVIVIEEKTSETPSSSASYTGKTAFPMSIYSSRDSSYTVFMGMYEGKLTDVTVDFDWGRIDIYDL